MSAPERKLHRSASSIYSIGFVNNTRKARKKIPNDLEIGDQALIDCDVVVKIINKGNCAATVEFSNGDRTVISYDRLSKLQKEPTSFADEEGQ
ncbi:hypothetical protein [Enterococcus wangshanyuanii]|uniref:DUF2187 domain-containing protein n=1 Tax=Enterococcus wangshanyuanii TaxID=2005703 RepID=A0ABQ1PY63_9ENTE|nr:hypothetical protein [Enterococcus wangshanyuanii]GGD06253.1 hypothetical protein GCM10011573_39590 [Enterococcus wangshanyuanii]